MSIVALMATGGLDYGAQARAAGNAGAASHTQAGRVSADLEAEVETLAQAGVVFEIYGSDQLRTDENAIAAIGDARSAWFKDPEGNILSVINRND